MSGGDEFYKHNIVTTSWNGGKSTRTQAGGLIENGNARIERASVEMFTNNEQPENANINPLDTQIGGNHYKNMAIQPLEFIARNKIEFIPGCVIKRMCRYRAKDGKKDLLKARHEIDVLISLEYGE